MLSRRQFLRGAGGFALALPMLPSLLSREAAAAVGDGSCRFFVSMGTHHGGIWGPNMYPDDATLADAGRVAGHVVRSAGLSLDRGDVRNALSPVLSAPSTALTDTLVEKMNIIRGVDIPFYIAHHTGGHLGNYARNDGNGIEGLYVQDHPRPTIDQVMAMSSDFYPTMDGVVERSIAIGGRGMSWGYASPSSGTGELQEKHAVLSNRELFDRLFRPGEGPSAPSDLIVDRVLDRYQALREGSSRLGVDDARRLDEHMERLFEVERRLNVDPSCTVDAPTVESGQLRNDPSYPHDPDAMVRFWQLQNDIVTAAFACGVCRIATINAYDTFSTFQGGDWHQDIAHQANLPDGAAQQTIADAHQVFFADVFVDLCQKLDGVRQPGGQTLLDDALVMWTQESGIVTHNAFSIPIITAGSAGGYFGTGQYVDFRNLDIEYTYDGDGWSFPYADHPGLIYNQWLATALRSMGVDPEPYRQDGDAGYGLLYVGDDYETDYEGAVGVVDDDIPFVTA